MHAKDGNWSEVIARMKEIVDEYNEIPDEYEIQSVFVTGSLAYGDGTPEESDADIVIGDNREESDYSVEVVGTVTKVLREYEGEFAQLLEIPVTTVHIVEVTPVRRSPHRAMELQHQGKELAERHGVDKSVEMRIYDAVHREGFSDARNTSIDF